MGAVVLPGAGGDDLAGGERLARGAQALDLVEELDQAARARTVEPVGFQLTDQAPHLGDRTLQLLEHDTSPGARMLGPGKSSPLYTNTCSVCNTYLRGSGASSASCTWRTSSWASGTVSET